MVELKELNVRLQVLKDGTWTACEDFESLKSVKDKFNSANKMSTCVQCTPGRFRFHIALSEQYVWPSEANALSIDLTFDGGDPIDHYRVVVLKSGDESSYKELGLNKMTKTHEGSSCHIETIAMPLDRDDSSSPWFETAFEFEKYARGMLPELCLHFKCSRNDTNRPHQKQANSREVELQRIAQDRNSTLRCQEEQSSEGLHHS